MVTIEGSSWRELGKEVINLVRHEVSPVYNVPVLTDLIQKCLRVSSNICIGSSNRKQNFPRFYYQCFLFWKVKVRTGSHLNEAKAANNSLYGKMKS